MKNCLILLFGISVVILLCCFIMLNGTALAKDFGVQGHTFEIKEEGFLSMIYRKLKGLDIDKENEKMRQLAKERIEEPEQVSGIRRTEKEQSFTYDPTYTLDKDAILPDGRVIYKAGIKVNPLDYLSLEKKLVFIDARDKEQVEWFKEQKVEGSIKLEDKLILVAGRPFDLEKELDSKVYFDQAGVLTSKFKIEQVPAIVQQEKKYLRITEVYIGKNQ